MPTPPTGNTTEVRPYLLPAEPVSTLDEYLATEVGGLGLKRALTLGPDATTLEITRAGLRGRGGAGFPTGRKWAGVRAEPGSRRFVVANGAEGEPGTFKDRALMRTNPFSIVEGVLIAAYVLDAERAYLALKERFTEERDRVTQAVIEMQEAGICRDCEVVIVAGPDEYLFGEEKGLLEVIEGNAPLPRVLPPYQHGLFATSPQLGWTATTLEAGEVPTEGANPTLVNNIETFANVTHVLARGADWFRTMGTERSPGNVVCTVVGDVVHPGVGEVELGTPLRDVIDVVGGGTRPGRTVKAVFSGVANPVVTASNLDVQLSYEGFEAIGSAMGACGFIVFDDTACMVDVATLFSRFLYVESCGQCPPCKLGSGEITARLDVIRNGSGGVHDVEEIAHWLARVTDGNRCFLAVEEQQLVGSILREFADEVAAHLEGGRCPSPRDLVLPKLVDLRDGVAVYDEEYARKQPDWTYAPVTEDGVAAPPGTR